MKNENFKSESYTYMWEIRVVMYCRLQSWKLYMHLCFIHDISEVHEKQLDYKELMY